MISYDLAEPRDTEAHYDRVIDAIKALGPWAHLQRSVWLTGAAMTTEEIRDALDPHFTASDRLFVAHLTDWAGLNLTNGRLKWLRRRSVLIGDE